jgi:hypothetical protein
MVETLQSDEAKWNLVIEAVYGAEAPASCSIVEGKITFSASPRPYSAKPNMRFLSEVLRSDEPIPAIAREWLANLFDPDGVSDYFRRRDGKKKPVDISHNWAAGRYAAMRMLFGDRYDNPDAPDARSDDKWCAIENAAKKFGLSDTAVAAALESLLNAQRVHEESL